ncbi:sensor histidine kinase [Agathobacter ruminis]|uniref:Sensor histidine kinase NatK-like C-terminal domain-containing protein n=1 Tax=Agathobacter ruminis TaxID=1712665 RepID=A0A2G3E5E1_9FIRM|nr:sensor histidine kinase [Agathobacter ruminis]MDC7302573.1 GHKL domain-containing protein [Agathobacter ruminis]PHU38293.1 hypothetical protein CSX02_03700 [Agathobacter ruminis]
MYWEVLIFISLTILLKSFIFGKLAANYLNLCKCKILQAVVYFLAISFAICMQFFISNIWLKMFLTAFGLSIIVLAYRDEFKKRILFWSCVFSSSFLIDCLVYVLFYVILGLDDFGEPASILSIFLLLPIQLFTGRIITDDYKYRKKQWIFYGIALFLCLLTSVVIYLDKTIGIFSLEVVCGFLLFINLIIAFLVEKLVEQSKEDIDYFVLQKQNEFYERELALQNEKVELIRSIRHDMKRHLNEILNLARKNQNECIVDYILSLGEELEDTSPICDSGNVAIDTVLNYMFDKAIKAGIQPEYSIVVPQELKISMYDMNIILGNLLQNAIDACELTANPQINVDIRYVMDSLVIVVENSYANELIIKEDRLETTKEPREEHGYGLANVKRILSKYDHSFSMVHDESRFKIEIILYLPY